MSSARPHKSPRLNGAWQGKHRCDSAPRVETSFCRVSDTLKSSLWCLIFLFFFFSVYPCVFPVLFAFPPYFSVLFLFFSFCSGFKCFFRCAFDFWSSICWFLKWVLVSSFWCVPSSYKLLRCSEVVWVSLRRWRKSFDSDPSLVSRHGEGGLKSLKPTFGTPNLWYFCSLSTWFAGSRPCLLILKEGLWLGCFKPKGLSGEMDSSYSG